MQKNKKSGRGPTLFHTTVHATVQMFCVGQIMFLIFKSFMLTEAAFIW